MPSTGQAELPRETEILEAVFRSIPVMISIFDSSGRLLRVNREWERVLGWTLEEAQSTDILSEAYPDPDRRVRSLSSCARRKAEGGWQDFHTRTREGRLIEPSWLRCTLSDDARVHGWDSKRLDAAPDPGVLYPKWTVLQLDTAEDPHSKILHPGRYEAGLPWKDPRGTRRSG